MSIMDARGRVRPGVFEKVYDDDTDTTFTPMSGIGGKMTFKAEGPRVQGDGIFTAKRCLDKHGIRIAAEHKGIIRPPAEEDLPMLAVIGVKRGKHKRK